jgi:hypothetical protein
MNGSIKEVKTDVFERPILNKNKNLLYDDKGNLKPYFKPKEVKNNRLEKPIEKKKDKNDKFM